MLLYFDSPRVWSPSPDQSISEVLTAIQVPAQQSEIQDWNEYLTLLAYRVEWMIHQENDLRATCRMIHRYLNEGRMDHQIWHLPDPEEDPEQWAEAITLHNPLLQMRLSMQSDWTFPLRAIESVETLDLIRQTPLEVWLQSMAYQPRED